MDAEALHASSPLFYGPLFYVLAGTALLSSLAVVGFLRSAVAGVLGLLTSAVSLAGIYVLLDAPFLAAAQLVVQGGGVVVLLLFASLLLGARPASLPRPSFAHVALATLGIVGSAGLLWLWLQGLPVAHAVTELPEGFGGFRSLGGVLYTRFGVAVQLAGFLLLAAVVGAVVLAKRRLA